MDNKFWKQNKALIFLIAVIAVLICVIASLFFRTNIFVKAIRSIASILTPFIYGFVIAYLLRPMSLKIQAFLSRMLSFIGKNRGKKGNEKDKSSKNVSSKSSGKVDESQQKSSGCLKIVSIALSLILMFAAIVCLLLLILPQLITSISNIIAGLPGAIEQFQEWLAGLETGETTHEIVNYTNEIVTTVSEKLQSYLQSSLMPALQTFMSTLTSSFMGIFNVLKDFGLGCIISIYFLSGWEKFGMQGKMIVYSIFPQRVADWIRDEVHYVDKMFSGFIIGKIVDSVIIGLICFAFTKAFGFPYALLVSLLVGVTNVIPFFGPYLGSIPSVLLILTEDTGKALIFLIFIIILQQVDGNVIGPKILGDKLGLSSFWILFSILFFGALWGLVGMLIGAPVFAVVYDLIRRYVFAGLRYRNRTDLKDQYEEKYGGGQDETTR